MNKLQSCKKVLILFIVSDVFIDYSAPLDDWIDLLEIEEEDAVRTSIRKIGSTNGLERTYFFIRSIEEAYNEGKCSEAAYCLAKLIYQDVRPMPADF